MTRAAPISILRVEAGATRTDQDLVASEAPLSVELRSAGGGPPCRLGVLMRTPGDDLDLLLGWLFTERVIGRAADVLRVEFASADGPDGAASQTTVLLSAHIPLDQIVEYRALTPTSACGLCGRLAVGAVDRRPAAVDERPRWPAALVAGLPAALLTAQTVFAATGGLHAAALCDDGGVIQLVREDIGRHNAVDKVIGAALAADRIPGACPLLVVSGRVAFEIVQKAAEAGLSAIVAVGAPSDLAIRAARDTGLTLVGFARDGRFNVYAGAQRIAPPPVIPAL